MKKLVGRLAILALALIALASCGSGAQSNEQAQARNPEADASAPASGGADSCAVTESPEISAADSLFDKDCLAAPAGRPFNVAFNNTDGFGHSFAVYEKAGGNQLFRGEIFNGPRTLSNEIGALEAGTYHFQCDVHPFVMQGTLKVQ